MGARMRNPRTHGWVLAAAAAALAAGNSNAATSETPDPPDAATQTPSTEPAAPEGAQPEYLQPRPVPDELIRPAKPQAIILPSVPSAPGETDQLASGGIVSDVPEPLVLLPEGYILARREGRFEREGEWWTFRVAGLRADPLRVLPNRRLGLLERVLETDARDATYLVTGRVTEFLGRNYLLLEEVLAEPAAPAEAPPPTREAARAEGGGEPPATSADTAPPSAEAIIQQLMADGPPTIPHRTPAAPAQPPPTEAGPDASKEPAAGTPGQPSPAPLPAARDATEPGRCRPEGTLLPEFPARLIRLDDRWLLARESRGAEAAPPPYPVLPNRMLEVMVSASRGGQLSLVFLVSGELTEYRGGNYLLVRKVLIRRDDGNVR
jgi:hypothetical protein